MFPMATNFISRIRSSMETLERLQVGLKFEEGLQEHFFHLNASPFCCCQSKLWESWLWRTKEIKKSSAPARRATSGPWNIWIWLGYIYFHGLDPHHDWRSLHVVCFCMSWFSGERRRGGSSKTLLHTQHFLSLASFTRIGDKSQKNKTTCYK